MDPAKKEETWSEKQCVKEMGLFDDAKSACAACRMNTLRKRYVRDADAALMAISALMELGGADPVTVKDKPSQDRDVNENLWLKFRTLPYIVVFLIFHFPLLWGPFCAVAVPSALKRSFR
jgi:hypothetical protein